MQALGVTAPDVDRVIDSLISELASRGRVGMVRSPSNDSLAESGAVTEYVVGSDGWQATGEGLSVPEILNRLARDHEYAVVTGAPDARIPHLVVGEATVRWELLQVPDETSVDPVVVADTVDDADAYESLESLVAKAKRASGEEYAGAIATFTGRVRAKDGPDEERTDRLEFERYDTVAGERMATIRSELKTRKGVEEVLLHHRTGVLEAGEDIVFVVVLAGHRDAAFETVEDGINRLKDEVPIFKKEVTVEEEFWVHERS